MSILLNTRKRLDELDSWIDPLENSGIPPTKWLKNGISFLLPNGKEMNLKPIDEGFEHDKSDEATSEVFTNSEAFIKNSTKIQFLKEGIYNVDPIFFWVNPELGIYLAASQLIKKLSGIVDPGHINFILSKNQGIYDYLLPFYKINLSVYQHSLLKITGIPQDLSKVILMALTEVLILQNHEHFNHPYLSLDQLCQMGLYQRLEDKSYRQTMNDAIPVGRDILHETNHITMHFLCFECMTPFQTSEMLLTHVKEHGPNYGCGQCGLKFEDYTQKIAHSISFCRYPKHKICFYCQQEKGKCICHQNFLTMSSVIIQLLKEDEMENMISKNLFSSWFQHFYEHSVQRDNLKVMISTGAGVTEDTVLDTILPKLIFSPTEICWYDDYVIQISEVKRNLMSKFSDFRDIIMEIDNFIKLFSLNCWVPGCKEENVENHIRSNHLLCPYSTLMNRNEAPEFVSKDKFLRHFYNHCKDNIPKSLQCTLCLYKFSKTDQLLDNILDHKINSHKEEFLVLQCQQEQCSNVTFSDEKSLILHSISWHFKKLESVCQILSVKISEEEPKPSLISIETKTPTRLIQHSTKNLLDSLKNSKDGKSPIKSVNLMDLNDFKSEMNENNDEFKSIKGLSLDEAINEPNEGSQPNLVTGSPEKSKIVCRNEKHNPPLIFKSEESKQLHLMKEHSCPNCKYFAEMDRDIIQHFNSTHRAALRKCQLCGAEVESMQEHFKSAHFKCPSCQKYFNTSYDLAQHTIMCNSTEVEKENKDHSLMLEMNNEMKNLHLEDRKTELDFNAFLIKLISHSNISEEEKEMGKEIIQKRASQQIIAKERARNNLFASEYTKHLIFETPKFKESSSKEAVTKASALIGTIREEDIFFADPKESLLECLVNYEKLEIITKKIERVSILTAMSEGQCKIFLQGFLHYTVTDAVSAYAQREFLDLTYVQILTYLQKMFCPIDFSRLEIKVMNYKMEKGEDLIAFSSRSFRHLSLCSKRMPEDKRNNYVEQRLRILLKANLSDKIYKEVLEREAVNQEFNSKELLSFYLGSLQNQGRLKHTAEIYDVNSVIPTRYSAKNTNSEYRQQSKSKDYNNLVASNRPKTFKTPEKKKIRSVESEPLKNSRPKLSPAKKAYVMEKREKLGIKGDLEDDVWCLKCRKNTHFSRDCPTFSGPVGNTICYQYENNRKTPCGFHDPEMCPRKNTKKLPKQAIWGPKPNNKKN